MSRSQRSSRNIAFQGVSVYSLLACRIQLTSFLMFKTEINSKHYYVYIPYQDPNMEPVGSCNGSGEMLCMCRYLCVYSTCTFYMIAPKYTKIQPAVKMREPIWLNKFMEFFIILSLFFNFSCYVCSSVCISFHLLKLQEQAEVWYDSPSDILQTLLLREGLNPLKACVKRGAFKLLGIVVGCVFVVVVFFLILLKTLWDAATLCCSANVREISQSLSTEKSVLVSMRQHKFHYPHF